MPKKQQKMHDGLCKGSWSEEEKSKLIRLVRVSYDGTIKWVEIARQFNEGLRPGKFRIGKQCREQWANSLDPELDHKPFTPEDIVLLLSLNAREDLNKRWTRIAEMFYRQTGKKKASNAIKNYFYGSARSHLNRPANKKSLTNGVVSKRKAQKKKDPLWNPRIINKLTPEIVADFLIRHSSLFAQHSEDSMISELACDFAHILSLNNISRSPSPSPSISFSGLFFSEEGGLRCKAASGDSLDFSEGLRSPGLFVR